MKFDWQMPVRIVSGAGCVRTFSYGAVGSRCVIVTGKNLYKTNPVFSDLREGLTRCGVWHTLFAQVENNPSVETVFRAKDEIARCGADFVIGVGGGSAMDAAKVAALLAANPDVEARDVFDASRYSERPIPLILIGTTAGTGSEVTAVGVLTARTADGKVVKKSVKTPCSYADFALCDARYTHTLPPAVTVSTALDSVCHAAEAFYSKKSGYFERQAAQAALRTVVPALRAYDAGDSGAGVREALYIGALAAGMAINGGGTNLPHSAGYQLTNYLGYAHGFACAALLPQLLKTAWAAGDTAVLSTCGFDGVDAFERFVYGLMRRVMTPQKIDEPQARRFAEIAMRMPSLNNHIFTAYTFEDCVRLYLETSRALAGECHG